MTRREQLTQALQKGPRTLPDLCQELSLKPNTATWALADAMAAGEIQRSGTRRRFVYALRDEKVAPASPLWRVWA